MIRYCLFVLIGCPPQLYSQSTGNCSSPFEAPVDSTRAVSLHIRSANLEIRGSNGPRIRVSCEASSERKTRGVKIRFEANGLRIYGGSKNTIRLRIDVPALSSLLVLGEGGDLSIFGVTGDKDVELKAGNLTIAVGLPEDYRLAEGSVLAGTLRAAVFGPSETSGLFRSFRKENPTGTYSLHAHLLAGAIEFK
jgi:hypothetical protein